MDIDELMTQLRIAINGRAEWCEKLEEASRNFEEMNKRVYDLIDQLQPRIEVTKPQEYSLPGKPVEQDNAAPSERVLAVLTNSRLGPFAIAEFTGLSRKQVGPCLGALVKKGLVRNAGNGTWTAA